MKMKAAHYRAARETLGWTHAEIADTVGVSARTLYRLQNGETLVDQSTARLLRALVWARLTLKRTKFDELVEELRK